MRPRPMAEAMPAGTLAWASVWATRMKLVAAVSSSRRMRRVSVVRPDGPGAAPLRPFLRFMRMRSSGRSTGWSGWNSLSEGCRGAYGALGRRAGSWSSRKVSAVPGARGPAVKACLAAESSPR